MIAGKGSQSGSPLVSVVIPTFNRSSMVTRAVESALGQKRTPVEVILVDDGSTDGTKEALEKHRPRIRYIHQENGGVGKARNRGLDEALGRFILFLDSDDYLLPESLSELTARFSEQPAIGAVQGAWKIVDAEGVTLSEPEPWRYAPRLDLETWLMATPLFLGGMLVDREWALRIKGFDEGLAQAEDVDFVWRLSLDGCRMAWHRRPVVCYCKHGGNISSLGKEQTDSYRMVIDKIFRQPGLPSSAGQIEKAVRASKELWFAWRLYATGFEEEATPSLGSALKYAGHRSEKMILEWTRLFAAWFDEIGRGGDDLRGLLLCLAEVLEVEPASRAGFEDLLAWYAQVWEHYVVPQPGPALKGLQNHHGTSPRDLVSLAKSSLLITPMDRMLWAINRFWEDVAGLKMVPSSRKHDVAGLYLTAFGRASLVRRWDVAREALRQALRYTGHPRGLLAWAVFVTGAVRHIAVGRRRVGFGWKV